MPPAHPAQDVVVAQRDSAERRPTRAGRMSRTMVSTSGSSGIAREINGHSVGLNRPGAASRQPISRRNTLPSNSIASAAPGSAAAPRQTSGATAVTLSTRPPLARRHAVGARAVPGVKNGHAARQRPGDRDHGALFAGGRDSPATRAPWSPTPRPRVGRSAGHPPLGHAPSASVSPPDTSGSTTCVSGSPSRQLNSTTQGVPAASTMSPA